MDRAGKERDSSATCVRARAQVEVAERTFPSPPPPESHVRTVEIVFLGRCRLAQSPDVPKGRDRTA